MKKKLLFISVYLISFLFTSCASYLPLIIFRSSINFFPEFFDSFYYEYDFDNIKNKNVIIDRRIGFAKWAEPKIIIDGITFYFYLSRSFDESNKQKYSKNIKNHYPFIYIITPDGKYIANVLINRVVIYAGEIEYNMLERVKDISLSLEQVVRRYYLDNEEIEEVKRTGLIEYTISINDESTPINVRNVFVRFSTVPIDSKYKKIRMLFDISVKYTTGEEITINQETIGFLKLKKIPKSIWEYIWIP